MNWKTYWWHILSKIIYDWYTLIHCITPTWNFHYDPQGPSGLIAKLSPFSSHISITIPLFTAAITPSFSLLCALYSLIFQALQAHLVCHVLPPVLHFTNSDSLSSFYIKVTFSLKLSLALLTCSDNSLLSWYSYVSNRHLFLYLLMSALPTK